VADSEITLLDIAQEIRTCNKCILASSRKNAVPGEGPPQAEIMLIGEGPGFYENEQGRPFVGQAGKYLGELLNLAGLKRENVYITNVVKCRPPGNRDPQEEELIACRDYLDHQIALINPLIIVTLGRFSMARYFHDAKISLVHGRYTWVNGQMIIPMYHPAAGLHQPALKSAIEKDFSQLPGFIEKARLMKISNATESQKSPAKNPEEDATQLNLF